MSQEDHGPVCLLCRYRVHVHIFILFVMFASFLTIPVFLISTVTAIADFTPFDTWDDSPPDWGGIRDGECSSDTICTNINNCRLIKHLLDRSCLASDRLRQMICGFEQDEVMVCCPRGAFNSPFDDRPGRGGNKKEKVVCGLPMIRSRTRGLGSHPWVARVGYKSVRSGKLEYPCGGSIISRNTVLTAAHCALAKAEAHKLASVRIGEYDGSSSLDCTLEFCGPEVQDIPIKEVIVHPRFIPKNFSNDVALLILKRPINFTVTAQPVCLLENPNIELLARRGLLVGWGKTPGQQVTPERQQLLELPIVPPINCQKVYSSVIPVSAQQQLCVGGERGQDACSGFGGAPLVLLDHVDRQHYYQVGIASFGSNKCGAAGVPSVYTKITSFVEWIKDNMV